MGLLRAIAKHPSGRIGATIIVLYLILAALGAWGSRRTMRSSNFRSTG
jgi:hypothetical protein